MKKIIVVDDNPANINACKKALRDIYEVIPAPSAERMFAILSEIIPDLILLDVEMPGTNGYEAIRALKGDDQYKEIPVIFLSAMDDAQSEVEGLNLGAVDYIHKPFVSSLLIKRIETHISLIDGKKELLALNKEIAELLVPKSHEPKADEEVIRDLLKKSEVLGRMGHEMRVPLDNAIGMIEIAIKSSDMAEMKHCLGTAELETKLMREMLDNILDVR